MSGRKGRGGKELCANWLRFAFRGRGHWSFVSGHLCFVRGKRGWGVGSREWGLGTRGGERDFREMRFWKGLAGRELQTNWVRFVVSRGEGV